MILILLGLNPRIPKFSIRIKLFRVFTKKFSQKVLANIVIKNDESERMFSNFCNFLYILRVGNVYEKIEYLTAGVVIDRLKMLSQVFAEGQRAVALVVVTKLPILK